jgi:hypothetical protein
MTSALTKYKTLKMKRMWEAPSPKQEHIITLTVAVTSLKTKAGKSAKAKTGEKKKEATATDKGPQGNGRDFAWKRVAPKAGEPKKKVMKGKTYFWCIQHPNRMWVLHSPEAFLNLCRLHPKFTELEAAYNGGLYHQRLGQTPQTLQTALADSDREETMNEGIGLANHSVVLSCEH